MNYNYGCHVTGRRKEGVHFYVLFYDFSFLCCVVGDKCANEPVILVCHQVLGNKNVSGEFQLLLMTPSDIYMHILFGSQDPGIPFFLQRQ